MTTLLHVICYKLRVEGAFPTFPIAFPNFSQQVMTA